MSPHRVVYILGAGVNQCARAFDGFAPPLSSAFLRASLGRIRARGGRMNPEYDALLDYVSARSRVPRDRLQSSDIDIEDVMLWLEEDLTEAEGRSDASAVSTLGQIGHLLDGFIYTTLAEFAEENTAVWSSQTMSELAHIILRENAVVVTFNWDTILEGKLEQESGPGFDKFDQPPIRSYREYRRTSEGCSDVLGRNGPPLPRGYFSHTWYRAQSYGVDFDEYWVRDPMGSQQIPLSREEFGRYREEASPPVKVLKPHGSMNWFRYTSASAPKLFYSEPDPSPEDLRELPGRLALWDGGFGHGGMVRLARRGLSLSPCIVAGSRGRKAAATSTEPFKTILDQARTSLVDCDRLVVIGYSCRDEDGLDLLRNWSGSGSHGEFLWVGPSIEKGNGIWDSLGHRGRFDSYSSVDLFVWNHPEHREMQAWHDPRARVGPLMRGRGP